MYNYQEHLRQSRLEDHCRHIQDQFTTRAYLRKQRNIKMSASQGRRVDAFMLSTLESPVQVNEFKHPEYLPRKLPFNPDDYPRHPMPFRMNSHTSAERLRDINQKTKELDGVPFQNCLNHKFREMASSFKTKPLRMNASCSAFRVYENLSRTRSNEVQWKDNDKLDKLFRASCSLNNRNKSLKNFQKGLIPSLHRKTYFNSVRGLLNVSNEGRKEGDSQEFEGEKENKRATKEMKDESINRKKNALEALTRCGLLSKTKK